METTTKQSGVDQSEDRGVHTAEAAGSEPAPATMRLKEWQVPLADHQTRVLRKEKVMLSAAHTGAGKTYLACQTIRDLGMKTLVVCPKIAISQWKSVIRGMGAGDYVVGVTNPENLIASKKNPYYDTVTGWKLPVPMLLVVDEIHRGCSGVDSKTTLAVAKWADRQHEGNKVLAMSATPFDSPIKMRCIGYLMGFHRFVERSFYDWCRAHACSYVDIGMYKRRRIFRFTTNKSRAEEIMRIIRRDMGERFLSIGPGDIPGFPPETREVVLLDLPARDKAALDRAYSEMPAKMKDLTQDDMVQVLRLRQQAEFCKAEAIAEMAVGLEEDGYSVFVMINFTDARLRIEEYLRKKGVAFASIYGGQKETERQAGIDAFQSNRTHVMVGMAAACSVALSLHDERHERPRVSLISPGYSSSELAQGLGRIRRVGGTAAVQKIVIAADSVEERVGKAVERKLDNIAALTDRDLMR